MCLVLGEAIAQKAPKLWVRLSKWSKDFGLEHWDFIAKFLDLQKKGRAKHEFKEEKKIIPDYNYIKDIVAGRPVLTHPLRKGGFRLRYRRSRASGLASMSIHPATMVVLDDFIALGKKYMEKYPEMKRYRKPSGVIMVKIDKLTGKLFSSDCLYPFMECFLKGNEPLDNCTEEDHFQIQDYFGKYEGPDEEEEDGEDDGLN